MPVGRHTSDKAEKTEKLCFLFCFSLFQINADVNQIERLAVVMQDVSYAPV